MRWPPSSKPARSPPGGWSRLAWERIADPAGEGARAFVTVHAAQARAMADATDTLRRAGRAASRYAGIPISLKDLVDIEGETTRAGSRVLDGAPLPPRTRPWWPAFWLPASSRWGEAT